MLLQHLLVGLVRVLVGASPRHAEAQAVAGQAIYFANHSSHIDTVALWSALPPAQRAQTRPVAALDYWGKGALRRYVALKLLNAVLIDRSREQAGADPLQPLHEALTRGDSLILFPEGTRRTEALPGTFKSGLYRLAAAHPQVALVPVYLENLHRSLPKGSLVPVPLICTVRFGAPLALAPAESKDMFLARARQAVIDLS